jgi:hypothetical protein
MKSFVNAHPVQVTTMAILVQYALMPYAGQTIARLDTAWNLPLRNSGHILCI